MTYDVTYQWLISDLRNDLQSDLSMTYQWLNNDLSMTYQLIVNDLRNDLSVT